MRRASPREIYEDFIYREIMDIKKIYYLYRIAYMKKECK
jgi:hypothetical protein